MFTPTNISMNCAFSHIGLRLILVTRGYQWFTPAMMANTAPMDST